MRKLTAALAAAFLFFPAFAQSPVPDVVAAPPAALQFANGRPVASASAWPRRRAEIIRLFASEVYGQTPTRRLPVTFHVDSTDPHALNGLAVRKQITVSFSPRPDAPRMHILLYIPASASGPVPVFEGLNFTGNQSVSADPGIDLGPLWLRDPSAPATSHTLTRQTASADSRGRASSQWQVEKILARGFALATVYYGDIEPDFDGGMPYGVRSLFLAPHATPGPHDWAAIGAWAWGLSRIADYLVTDPAIDAHKIAVMGHSRLGKTALWAAAQDLRFALVVSNESGKGGASLYRRIPGETIEHLNTAFPHWFCTTFHQYTGHPDRVPVDANLLLSLVAPRPLYVASAEDDHTSDPAGEFYSTVLASPVFELLGKPGVGTSTFPPVNHPVGSASLGYHVRTGKHDVTAYDWDRYLDFASAAFGSAKAQ